MYVQPNILVDDAGHARITDFGLVTLARNLDSIRSASGDQGHTIQWTAPEILSDHGPYSKEADVFSFAMVVIEVRREWFILVEHWLTAISYHHRHSQARSRSQTAYLKRLLWP